MHPAAMKSNTGVAEVRMIGMLDENWPKTKDGKDLWLSQGIRDPVVPLVKALYGHPDAGGYWEKHCNDHLAKIGFVPVDNWPSMFWHQELSLLLMVYVDDFEMAGPKAGLVKGWKLIREGLDVDDPAPC